MTILYFDCFSGASGDMILGALIDAGCPLADLRRALGTLAVDPEMVWTERVMRAGVTATKLQVRGEGLPVDLAHDRELGAVGAHAPHGHASGSMPRHALDASHRYASESPRHHVHRTVAEVERLIEGSALSSRGRARTKELFRALGEVEAAIHGTTIEKVHLHEVGAIDSIIDIAGTVYALEALGVERVVSSPLNVGGGSVQSAHGLYPVPAPATLRLLEGAPIYAGSHPVELVTPTGALLVTRYADSYGPVPAMRLEKVGYGAGTRDFTGAPNVLRVLIGEEDQTAPARSVVAIEAEIDDMNPQIFGVVMDRLLAADALDVFYTAIQMKKGRPGTLLTVIAPPEARERLTAILFRETTTIGLRYREMMRECLDRETVTVDTPYGMVAVKVARRNGEVLNASPEFDDCARLAAEAGAPVKNVQAAAMKGYLDRR